MHNAHCAWNKENVYFFSVFIIHFFYCWFGYGFSCISCSLLTSLLLLLTCIYSFSLLLLMQLFNLVASNSNWIVKEWWRIRKNHDFVVVNHFPFKTRYENNITDFVHPNQAIIFSFSFRFFLSSTFKTELKTKWSGIEEVKKIERDRIRRAVFPL